MVACSAFGCANRSEQGFIMKVFPKDSNRRKEWAIQVKREDWIPTNNSYLCEIHFAPEMWEKTREDGSRKLKHNAVPTIFSFAKQKPSPIKRKPIEVIYLKSLTETDLENPAIEPEPSTSTYAEIVNIKSESEQSFSSIDGKEREQLIVEIAKYENGYKTLLTKIKKYRNCTRNLKRKIKMLELVAGNKNRDEESTTLLKQVLNDDQIVALKRKSCRFMKWSNATVMKALKLKFSCGDTGYKEILKIIPLPSLRTLRRHLENKHFDRGI